MSRQAIGIGAAANDGTGDPLRTAFTKANDNFSEIYSLLGGDTLTIAGARTALGIGTADSPTFAGVTLGALSTIHFTGLTANALLLSDGTDLTQSANLTYTTANGPRLQLGTGSLGSSGWILGYGFNAAESMIWTTGVTPSSSNYSLWAYASGLQLLYNVGTNGKHRFMYAAGDTVSIEANGVIGRAGVAFASLPTGVAGMTAYVTDSSTATWGATIAGSGANKVLAFFNGTNWTVSGA